MAATTKQKAAKSKSVVRARATVSGSAREAVSLHAFMAAADAFDQKHGRSKSAAHKQLVKEGVLTKSGRLTARYK